MDVSYQHDVPRRTSTASYHHENQVREDERKYVDTSHHGSGFGEQDNEFRDLPCKPQADWVAPDVRWAVPPSALMVTHVNQTHDLVKSLSASDASSQSSEEWLQNHSIKSLQLTLKDLLNRGKLAGPQADQSTGKASHNIRFDASDINEFEHKLNLAIEGYNLRIKWLLQGSKKVFGLVKGKRVAVAVDCSDVNTSYGRLTALQEFFTNFLDEQLCRKSALYLTSFGTRAEPLWPILRDVNVRILNEAKDWVSHLQPKGGCNVLQAFKQIVKLKDLDSIVFILGSVPDQSPDILSEFLQQTCAGLDIPVHTVAYDCSNHLSNMCLRNLAEVTGGRYHCYTSSCEELIYSGTDISLLMKEIKEAQDTIGKIHDTRQGMMGNALVSILDEIAIEVQKLPQSCLLPRPPGHNNPLEIDQPKFQPRSSEEWIRQHGLKAKQLDLYQMLAPNAYSYHEDFIPVIGKAVQSQVHQKAMVQFQWYDGSVRNVHVDLAQMFDYQKQLGAVVSLYEQRIEWLSTGSRRIFGTISGKNVVILVDLSMYNMNYLIHIQHSLRLLLEQQLLNKDYFNIISFGNTAKSWSPTMKKPTEQNLQAAWKWILGLQCEGSRNFLSAFRMTVQNEEEIKHGINPNGIYLFTSGVPDQPESVCLPYIEESCAGRGIHLHASLFNVEDYNQDGAIPSRYASITKTAECMRSMAHCSGGRFHWFRETGIIESDDIQCIMTEIDKALNYSKKCSQLTQSVKRKYQAKQSINNPKALLALPSPTPEKRAVSCVPAFTNDNKQVSTNVKLKSSKRTLTPVISKGRYSPLSNQGYFSLETIPVAPMALIIGDGQQVNNKKPLSAKNKMEAKDMKVITSSFFLEEKGAVGSVFKKFPVMKAARKSFKTASLTGIEDYVSTKEWLLRYSLTKLKLNLNKLVSGPACKHDETSVKILHRPVTAKYCSIFPSINVSGTIRHLQLLPHELKEYSERVEEVLQHYLKRLQWLLSGSRRIFGTIIHKHCTFLIDTSGSMNPYMDELKKEIAALIWEQLYKNQIHFNFIGFAGSCRNWQTTVQPPTEDMCQSAVEWTSRLLAAGNTCTLEALEAAFSDSKTEAIYLLTDGKPDTSMSLVLRQVQTRNTERQISVNTISFNCSDSVANNFLKRLARETAGRYHRCEDDFNIKLFIHKLQTEGFRDTNYPHLPEFDGDDLQRLGKEVKLARTYLSQSIAYRDMYTEYQKSKAKTKGTCDIIIGESKVKKSIAQKWEEAVCYINSIKKKKKKNTQ